MKLDRKNVAVANFILLPRASPRVVTLPGGIWGLPGIVVAMHPSNTDPRPVIWDWCAIAG